MESTATDIGYTTPKYTYMCIACRYNIIATAQHCREGAADKVVATATDKVTATTNSIAVAACYGIMSIP